MRRSRLIIGGIALAAALALTVAACGGEYGDDDDAGGPAAEPPGIVNTNVDDGASEGGGNVDQTNGGTTGGGGTGGGGDGFQVGSLDRKIIRDATIEITVESVPSAVAQIENLATRSGGFVSGSSMTIENPQDEKDEQRQRATISIRVPASQYPSILQDVRELAGEVVSESSQATEVTEEYTDLQSELRNLQATEAQYLELLTRAETIDEILTVQDRLNSVRSQIERVQGRLNVLDDLTELATITVDIELPPLAPAIVEETGGQNWAEEAWVNAWNVSEDALKVVGVVGITASVFVLWLIVPAAIAGGALWVASRRSRRQTTTSA